MENTVKKSTVLLKKLSYITENYGISIYELKECLMCWPWCTTPGAVFAYCSCPYLGPYVLASGNHEWHIKSLLFQFYLIPINRNKCGCVFVTENIENAHTRKYA